jgi:hypothetical protein
VVVRVASQRVVRSAQTGAGTCTLPSASRAFRMRHGIVHRLSSRDIPDEALDPRQRKVSHCEKLKPSAIAG